MNKYTIYCTDEQTRKAFELGAPIITTSEPLYNHPTCGRDWVKVRVQGNSYSARIPTAEQMIGWLEDKFELRLFCGEDTDGKIFFNVYNPQKLISEIDGLPSRKEATLAAIDAALDYLEKR